MSSFLRYGENTSFVMKSKWKEHSNEYKIGEAKGNTILINLEVFDEYMEQFREPPTEMKHPLPNVKGDWWMSYSYKCYSDTKDFMKKFVNAEEGAIIYGISKSRIIVIAREAGAVYKVGNSA